MEQPKRILPPAIVLLFLAPAIGELLSGSSPPTEFFTPFGFTILVLLYGGGAILCREIKVRWGKGAASLLLLGSAYAVLEEGIMVASFYNPAWPDLGVLGLYGRWLGVNWVWLVELTIYHAIISITIPVTLVELVYPNQQGKPWLGKRWFLFITFFFTFNVIGGSLLFSVITGYKPTFSQIGFSLFLIVLFIFLSGQLPYDWFRRGKKKMRRPPFYFITTSICTFFKRDHFLDNTQSISNITSTNNLSFTWNNIKPTLYKIPEEL